MILNITNCTVNILWPNYQHGYSATKTERHATKSSRLPWRHLRRAAESNPRGPTCSSYLQPLKRVEKTRNKLLEIGILLIVYNKLINGYDIYICYIQHQWYHIFISSWFIHIEISDQIFWFLVYCLLFFEWYCIYIHLPVYPPRPQYHQRHMHRRGHQDQL